MKNFASILICVVITLVSIGETSAQQLYSGMRAKRVRGAQSAVWMLDERGDSILFVKMSPVRIYSRMRDMKEYQRMIKAVKKVYPLALQAAERMEHYNEEVAELERRRDRKEYTSAIEDALKEEITPMLWKMTRYEGQILLKLIDRETNHTAFSIIKDFRSGFTAGFYQMLAKLFGNNLKLHYDPEGEDKMLEQIVLYYKAGLL